MFVGVEAPQKRAKKLCVSSPTEAPSQTRYHVLPAYWGNPDQKIAVRRCVPLNPEGELINWAIVESNEGLKHVRDIAGVKRIGLLWPGQAHCVGFLEPGTRR